MVKNPQPIHCLKKHFTSSKIYRWVESTIVQDRKKSAHRNE